MKAGAFAAASRAAHSCLASDVLRLSQQGFSPSFNPSRNNPAGLSLSNTGSADGGLPIGLGHDAIADFLGEEGAAGIIAPNLGRLARLDYLALGDRHGQMQVTAATWYSGTPEANGLKHAVPAAPCWSRWTEPRRCARWKPAAWAGRS